MASWAATKVHDSCSSFCLSAPNAQRPRSMNQFGVKDGDAICPNIVTLQHLTLGRLILGSVT